MERIGQGGEWEPRVGRGGVLLTEGDRQTHWSVPLSVRLHTAILESSPNPTPFKPGTQPIATQCPRSTRNTPPT